MKRKNIYSMSELPKDISKYIEESMMDACISYGRYIDYDPDHDLMFDWDAESKKVVYSKEDAKENLDSLGKKECDMQMRILEWFADNGYKPLCLDNVVVDSES